MSADEPKLKSAKKNGITSYFLPLKNTFPQNLKKNDAQCGYNSPTVELSQTINDFQQQQTGRLLSINSTHGRAV